MDDIRSAECLATDMGSLSRDARQERRVQVIRLRKAGQTNHQPTLIVSGAWVRRRLALTSHSRWLAAGRIKGRVETRPRP
jgi:hypothetical protein